ncbi:unnamed protein product [Rotaria sordida]|uniref:G-protein coupled receptors family 1 profile domain-containing protein n=1 Tax=Rotaria sordida TaxID=392033 RepID=A0A818N9B2_9BILA|nr:unnamed protein product [Rotaria sordida]CAF0942292.1 unnamed protein product [Rotaria sordida]CAF3601752.1 unnamed protein product [Rotaria sordida]CAF3681768.1 unnamed protein product [Rotaria sordida]
MANSSYYLNQAVHVSFIQTTTPINYILLGNRIGTIIYSIIYILGFLGNTFALMTFSSRCMRQNSSGIFLLILSISDIIALVTSIWFYLSDAFAINLQNYSALACRLRTFLAYVFMDLSSWCVAGLAFDRYIRIRLPMYSINVCTPRNALIMILIFFLLLCGINGHYFSPGIGQERGENRTTAHCLENREKYPNYYYFYKIIWPKIDMIIFCFLPACIMILCNVNIIYLHKKRLHNFENLNNYRLKKRSTQINIQQTLNGILPVQKASIIRRRTMERQMSLMMAACVIVFLCTTLPITIYLILLEQVIMKNPNFARNNAFLPFIFRMLRALMYIHFGSNFYLYCLTSRIFRAEFIQQITFRKFIVRSNHDQSKHVMPNKLSHL